MFCGYSLETPGNAPNEYPQHTVFYLITTLYIRNVSDLILLLLNTTCPVLANSADPDQLASEEANWSGSALFVIKYMYVNFYQKLGSNNLIGWKLEVRMTS